MQLITEKVVARVRSGEDVSDKEFDALLPERLRRFSANHWTPLSVARRAIEMLEVDADTNVLDVGSGAGKFCILGTLLSPGKFTGVEQRQSLVEISRKISKDLGIHRAHYIHSTVDELDWKRYNAFYLFNPFVENLYAPADQIDRSVPLSPVRYWYDIRVVQQRLHRARAGTRVVTYHGFGGDFPTGYRSPCREAWGEDFLQLWIKETD